MGGWLPPNGTAGLARSAVSGARRLPSPPASTIPNTLGDATPNLFPLGAYPGSRERASHDALGFREDSLEVFLAQQALSVDLVDVLGPGGPRGEPAVLGDDLQPPDGGVAAWRRGEYLEDRLASQLIRLDLLRGQFLQHLLLLGRRRHVRAPVERAPEALGELPIQLAGIRPGAGRQLCREQAGNEPVLVGRPHRAVAAQERGAGALLSAEAQRAVEQPLDEPLEAHRHLDEPPPEVGRHPVDHAARDHRL